MDIIVDLETLGTDVDSTVIQIAAAEFDITTGELVGQPFNECVDLHYVAEIKASGNTLKFWLGWSENQKVIRNIVEKGETANNSESDLWDSFYSWLISKSNKTMNLKLWGNGISFDNMIIKNHLGNERYNQVVKFWNERDARTLVDMYCRKAKISDRDFKNSVPNENKHDAMADIIWEAKFLSAAYNGLNVQED
ncbi:3'-5' exonuclease [Lactococcus formosensis]|uniref:3'-5' exonuclease n=1 Tax=Lactococcus formosensis TaxID=1281486 RepID=UPI00254FC565|nr:3'-5' exonuclease [Lactococcus formosensis]